MTNHLELEKTLWQAADKLRSNMDAAEYKHVVLGLIFLKFISDAFDELFQQLDATKHETGADPEDKDEYTPERVFYVPPQARWKWLQGRAKLPTIGKDIDDAMDAIEKDIELHEHRRGKISIFGQESNPTTYKLAKMNLAIRGIDAKIELGDTLMNDKFPELKVDYVIANPPFNVSDYNINTAETHKWKYGFPPQGNANYAWLQHFVSKLTPYGAAGIVLANGSMSSEISTEGDIRKAMIEADLVDCMVALPSQLFYNAQIPACLWFFSLNKTETTKFRNRTNEILFIDAREYGSMISRKQRELTDKDIATIAETYHKWRASTALSNRSLSGVEATRGGYKDIPGFCKSATIEDIRKNKYILTPGRYIDFKQVEDDGIAFDEKMKTLTATLAEQMLKANELDDIIKENLEKIGYEF
jgi:type I restriction enzyme M protein